MVSMQAHAHGSSLRVVRIALDDEERRGLRTLPWEFESDPCRRIAAWGGTALGLSVLLEEAERDPGSSGPFLVTVGRCVARGVPTAARASLLGRSPLSGLLSEGQVGGSFALHLAAHADALWIEGRTGRLGAVLWIDAEGEVTLRSLPQLLGLGARATGESLERELGACASLAIGPAGERGIAFANIGTGEAQPSFVGRGGLGARLAAFGLKAIAVARPAVPPSGRGARDLVERLAASPRLKQRAQGGTFELYHAHAVRSDLMTPDGPLGADGARKLVRESEEQHVGQKGCRGCPTPCGWIFERDEGERQGAHFSASSALGTDLGFDRFGPALELLAACDRYGLDAKESGAVLALAAGEAGGPTFGDAASFLEALRAIVEGDPHAEPWRQGSVGLARSLGRLAQLPQARGQAARSGSSLAALLGQCVSSAGPDPMRSFPFLLDATSPESLERILGTAFPPGTAEPRSPVGKGELVFWHENLVTAVDMTGFCSFSMAGLLADEVADVDQLAAWILPESLLDPAEPGWSATGKGRRLFAAGANLVLLRRRINQLWGAPGDQDRPAWARARLEQPGMLSDYLELRGLDEEGYPEASALDRLGSPDLLPPVRKAPRAEEREPPSAARARGTVHLRSVGALERALGSEASVSLDLPAPVLDVLAAKAAESPELAGQLVRDGRTIPSVWREGKRLNPGDWVEDGDVLELVAAISGG